MAIQTWLNGPCELSARSINANVMSGMIGTYALGVLAEGNVLAVRYVGRSDDDLAGRLQSWTGNPRYTHFLFGYLFSAEEAFKKECRLFHDFGATAILDNAVHPDRPNGSNVACPVCPPMGLAGFLGLGYR
jgi:hypothetical protein